MPESGFWRRAAGCWAGEASYFDGDMQPIIAAYGNVLRIVVDADGALPEGEGFEVASLQQGRLGADDALELQGQGRFVSLDRHSAVRDLLDPATGAPRYRTWHTLPSDDVLATTQFGIYYTPFEADYYNRPLRDPVSGETRPNSRLGQLKGISVFRYRRIPTEQLEAARVERRARFRISGRARGDGSVSQK